MAGGRYRLRDAVSKRGRVVTCTRPLVVTRLNEAGSRLVDALSFEVYRSVAAAAEAADVDAENARSLLEALRRRGLLAWRPGRDPTHRPPASVVVTVRNEADAIGACLDALAALSYPDYEVVVVDDCSTDGTRERVHSHPLAESGVARLVTVDGDDPRGIGACRNLSVDAAAHDVVAFTDADCRPRADWLADLVPCLSAHDLVGGRIRPHGDGGASAYEGVNASLDMGPRAAPVDRESATPYLATANLVGRREVFEAVRFPERNVAEDVDVCWRAVGDGYDVVYTPEGVVEHDYGDATDFVGRRVAYGASEALLAGEYGHPGSVSVPLTVPAVALVGVLGGTVVDAGGVDGLAIAATVALVVAVAATLGRAGRTLWATATAESRLDARSVLIGTVRGGLSRLYAVATEVARYYSLPVAAVALALAAAGFETLAAAVAGLVVAVVWLPPLVEYAVHRPATSPVAYVAWATLDAVAYQVGAHRGAVGYRTATHLDPRRRFTVTA
ncbi:MAG: glycosyltransferase [Haloarculaceae archaeon]